MIGKKTLIIFIVIIGLLLLAGTVLAGKSLSSSGSSTIGMGIFEAGASKQSKGKTGIDLASLEMPGSDKGVQALLNGKVSVAGVSRTLKSAEKNRGLDFILSPDGQRIVRRNSIRTGN